MTACMTELVHDPIPATYSTEERQSREKYLAGRSVALLVISDGDDEQLRQCVDSAAEMLRPRWDRFEELWMCDASGDASRREDLARRYPQFRHIDAGQRRGRDAAIRAAWARLQGDSVCKFVFHLDQDFAFNRPVFVDPMALILTRQKRLAQVGLRCDGLTDEIDPSQLATKAGEISPHSDFDGNWWKEHRVRFAHSPSLYRRGLLQLGWPEHGGNGYLHQQLMRDGMPGVAGDQVAYAYFGAEYVHSCADNHLAPARYNGRERH